MSNLTPSILKFESPRLAEIKQHLRLDLECAADWRERKALQHPDDERNLEAAAILDRLIQTIDDINPVVRNSYGKLFRSSDAGLVEANIEAHNVMLRQVGFRSRPETAEEVCCEFIQTAGAAPQPQTARNHSLMVSLHSLASLGTRDWTGDLPVRRSRIAPRSEHKRRGRCLCHLARDAPQRLAC